MSSGDLINKINRQTNCQHISTVDCAELKGYQQTFKIAHTGAVARKLKFKLKRHEV